MQSLSGLCGGGCKPLTLTPFGAPRSPRRAMAAGAAPGAGAAAAQPPGAAADAVGSDAAGSPLCTCSHGASACAARPSC